MKKSLELTEEQAIALSEALDEAIVDAGYDVNAAEEMGLNVVREMAIDKLRDREELQERLTRLFPSLRRTDE